MSVQPVSGATKSEVAGAYAETLRESLAARAATKQDQSASSTAPVDSDGDHDGSGPADRL